MAGLKFKEGQVVRVKKNLNNDTRYGGIGNFKTSLPTTFNCWFGKLVTITDADYDHSYKIEEYPDYYFPETIFEEFKSLEVGDTVTIRPDLKTHDYGGVYVTEEMAKLKGKRAIITSKNKNSASDDGWSYWVDLSTYNWTKEMFISPAQQTQEEEPQENEKEVNEMEETLKDVTKYLKKISEGVSSRSVQDEALLESIKSRVKEVSKEEIQEQIIKDLNNYIKENYGILPKKIEVVNGEAKKEMVGLFHKKFDEILNIVNKGVPLMLTGPAGAGKNHTLEQVAEALGLDFYFSNAITQEYKLTGFIDANGSYKETQFYKAYKDGGLFFLDEVDASCPECLIILNCAIANGYFDFPIGRVNAHQNFRVVCAGNTFGTGADMVYVGRNALDGATLDRFATIEFDYDEDIEKQLAYDDELYNFIVSLRKAIKESSLRYIVSMRATINATKLLQIGMPKEEILKSVIIKNMQIDDLNTIIKKISSDGEWYSCLERVRNARN